MFHTIFIFIKSMNVNGSGDDSFGDQMSVFNCLLKKNYECGRKS